jgi:Family of unknown function (DUF6788)
MDMKSLKQSLEAKRLKPIQKINTLIPWVEGSFVSTSRFCGKKNCICHHGGSKHPVVYVTWKEKGKTVSLYVPRRLERDVRRWIQNYKKVKDLIREVSEIQKQIIRLRED